MDAERGERGAGIWVDYAKEDDEVADKEEDEREGIGRGRGTKRGRFGCHVEPCLDFPRSRGISKK
jgi:hypothetical protein